MIVIAGTVSVRPERRDDAVRLALRMAAATRAEPGCVEYRFFADLEDPNRFFLFEHWESDEALARHFQTPHMAEFRQHLPGLLAGPSTVRRYTVSDVAPM
jgi:quinol monooxygenase YgiN